MTRVITIINDGNYYTIVEGDRYQHSLMPDEALGSIAHIIIEGRACFGGLKTEAENLAPRWADPERDQHPFDHGGQRPVLNGRFLPASTSAREEMLDALRQWKSAETTGDRAEIENARIARDIAIERAGGAA